MVRNNEENSQGSVSGPRYWKSLDEKAETPEFKEWLHREFPQGAAEALGVNRRQFIKIMGASFALAGFGLAGCRRPEQKIVPYSRQPENMIPGVPKYFASSLPGAKDNIPLAVETHSARPTKIEGNGNYKPYGGATNAYAQASVLDLYDPDRAKFSARLNDGQPSKISQAEVKDFLGALNKRYAKNKGEGLAILLDESTSISRQRLLDTIRERFPKAKLSTHEAIDSNNPELATEEAYGKRLRAIPQLDKAKRILAIDSDFLERGPGALGAARKWSKGRKVKSKTEASKMNRLYQVESDFTVSGGMADHRLRLATAEMPAFVAGIGAAILHAKGVHSGLAKELNALAASLNFKDKEDWLKQCAEDMLGAAGKAIIIAGDHLPQAVHQIVAFLNEVIGAPGHTLDYRAIPENGLGTIEALAASIDEGSIETLFVFNTNPAYDAPGALNWKSVQKKVPEVVRVGTHMDETSKLADVHIATTHYLESWSDGRTFDGTIVPVQPMIHPLFDSMMELEVLARLTGYKTTEPYEIVYESFKSRVIGANSEKEFNRYLHRGYIPNSEHTLYSGSVRSQILPKAVKALGSKVPLVDSKHLEVRLRPSAQVQDGRYANNGWLQEMPEPMNKTCWDNTINISPRLAQELGYDPEGLKWLPVSAKEANKHRKGREWSPLGKLTVNGTTIEGPINIQPGLANYTVTIALGFGRTAAGSVGNGVGFDAYVLNTSGASSLTDAKLEIDPSKEFPIANVQQHWSMEGRAIIREANVDFYEKNEDFVNQMGMEAHSPPVYGKDKDKSLAYKATKQPKGASLYKTPTFSYPQQWGMSIDLNSCTGCNQCVIACQAENNIPIVGKDQVLEGREMHWIRMDRYYSSGNMDANKTSIPEDPQVSMQPMLCQQCETAPCEQVCPVNATVHDDQGLNVMAYNRCVGTRYCANNCPYKVRRFNFFDWNKRAPGHHYEGPLGPNQYETEGGKLKEMVQNPDVTVRMRGVMEKCTFCQQRIEAAKINQKAKAADSDAIEVPDGTIKTACEQACPTDAIVFGDIADENTEVYKLKQLDRDYGVLAYLNTRPRTTYLARLRNPNPKMPDYDKMPLSTMEYVQQSGPIGHGDGHGEHHGEHHHDAAHKHDAHSHQGHH